MAMAGADEEAKQHSLSLLYFLTLPEPCGWPLTTCPRLEGQGPVCNTPRSTAEERGAWGDWPGSPVHWVRCSHTVHEADEASIPAWHHWACNLCANHVVSPSLPWPRGHPLSQGPLFCLQVSTAEILQNTDYFSEQEL